MPPVAVGAIALGGAAIAAGGLGAALAATGFMGIVANFGASLLLSAAASALAPKPDFGMGPRDVSVREPASPRKMIYGNTRVGGTIVFLETSGDKRSLISVITTLGGILPTVDEDSTKMLHMVIVFAGHQVEAIDEIYFDDLLAFDASGNPQSYLTNSDEYDSYAYLEKRLGAPDQEALTLPADYLPEKWSPDHKLSGCAAIAVTLRASPEKFPNGVPNVTANIRGKNDILDPRTGTRGYTDNAALCLADYLADDTYGLGAAINDPRGINEDELIAAANACDEVVDTVEGATEKRYTLNGVIDTSQTPQTIIQAMLTSMAGHAVRRSGQWHVLPGVHRTSVMTLTETDAAGSLRLVTRLSRSDNFNAVRGTFVSPENDWQVDDFPPYESSAYLAEDRGRKSWKDITLPFTTSASMAQRIAKIELEMARRQQSIEWPGKLGVLQVGCGDVVNVTRDRWGFTDKPFIVTGMTFERSDSGLIPSLQLAETSPLVYDWNATEGQIYAAAPRTSLDNPFKVLAPGITGVSESLYVTRQNAVKARTTVAWSESLTGGVDRYELEGKLDGGEYNLLAITSSLSASVDDITPGSWTFRVRAVTALGADSDWSTATAQIYGLGAEPAAITGATLQAAGGLAVIKWALHPNLDVRMGGHIVIRHSEKDVPTWASSRSMDEITGNQTIAAMPLMPGTYLLRARDSSGVLGPITTLYASGAQVISLVSIGVLQEDDEFSGTHNGTVAYLGQLSLGAGGIFDDVADVDALSSWDYVTGSVVDYGEYDFATELDFGSVKRVRLRTEIETVTDNRSDILDDRPGTVDSWGSWDGEASDECDVYVEVSLSDDNTTWTDWARLDAAEVESRYVRARAILTTSDTSFQPLVSKLRLKSDEVI